MASGGSFQNTFRTGYTLRVEWVINSQDIEKNTSSVTVTAYLVSSGSSYTINSSASKTVKLIIDGTTYSKSASGLASLSGGQKKSLISKTVTVSHDIYGNKTIPIYCTFGIEVTLGGKYFGTVRAPSSGNGSAELDSIPRATTPTTSGTFNVGNTVTINTPRAVSRFYHKVFFSLDNSTWTQIADNVETSVSWKLPDSLATAKPKANSGTVYIRCATMEYGAFVGNKTITRTYNITSSYAAPSVSISVSQTNDANIDQYIRGYSNVTLKATGTFKYGASAVKYVFSYGGTSKTVTTTATSASVTFLLPSNAASSFAYSVTVTDSRGYTGSKSGTITVTYSSPTIDSLSIVRGNYDGTDFTENSKGNSLRIVATGTILSLANTNAKNYKVEYRLSNSINYTTLIDTKAASAYAVSVTEYTDAIFSENASYVLRFTLSDSFESVSQIVDVPSQKVLMNFSADGKAMAIGGIASVDDALEIMINTYSTGGMLPMQIANGTDFDEVVKTGLYVGNVASGNYVNAPVTSGTFVLEVTSAGAEGQLMQRYSYCNKTIYRAFVRFYYSNTWGEWQPTEGFTSFEVGTGYGNVRMANGFMVQWGRVSMVPTAANTVVSMDITFPVEFVRAPAIIAHPHTSAPNLVYVSASVGSSTGMKLFLFRNNTTATWVTWLAVGRG